MLTEHTRTGELVHFFDLPEAGGGRISSRQYRGKKNLVIFFMDSVLCGDCRERLKELASAYAEIQSNEGEMLVVLNASRETAAALKDEFSLKSPVLYDESGDIFRGYGAVDSAGDTVSATFITDRFGEIYYISLAGAAPGLPSIKEIISWLEFIEVQCPE